MYALVVLFLAAIVIPGVIPSDLVVKIGREGEGLETLPVPSKGSELLPLARSYAKSRQDLVATQLSASPSCALEATALEDQSSGCEEIVARRICVSMAWVCIQFGSQCFLFTYTTFAL